jgi:hypothetical protein
MQEYNTGARRSARMPRYDLIVGSAIDRLAQRCTGEPTADGVGTGGALKYGEGNWERGLPTSDVINHILQHIHRYADEFRRVMAARLLDVPSEGTPDYVTTMCRVQDHMVEFSKLDDHLAGAMWGLMVLCDQEEHGFYHDPAFERRPREAGSAADPRASGTQDHRHDSRDRLLGTQLSDRQGRGDHADTPSHRK